MQQANFFPKLPPTKNDPVLRPKVRGGAFDEIVLT